MDNDLLEAVELLANELELSDEAAEELLMVLEKTEVDPHRSILYPTNANFSVEIELAGSHRKAWLVGKKIYVHTFIFLVVQFDSGSRYVLEILHADRE